MRLAIGAVVGYRDTTIGHFWRIAMRAPSLVLVSALAIAMGAPVAGQSGKWTPPRTADGKPDLQGTFTFATITPLQRPTELAGKAVLTPEEAAKFEQAENNRLNRDLFTPE